MFSTTLGNSVRHSQSYSITVTRECNDLYRIDGTSYYLKTRFCFEFAFGEQALIRNYSPAGYSKGELCFSGMGDYDDCYSIEEVYHGEFPPNLGMKVLTMMDMIEDIQLILIPTKLSFPIVY